MLIPCLSMLYSHFFPSFLSVRFLVISLNTLWDAEFLHCKSGVAGPNDCTRPSSRSGKSLFMTIYQNHSIPFPFSFCMIFFSRDGSALFVDSCVCRSKCVSFGYLLYFVPSHFLSQHMWLYHCLCFLPVHRHTCVLSHSLNVQRWFSDVFSESNATISSANLRWCR